MADRVVSIKVASEFKSCEAAHSAPPRGASNAFWSGIDAAANPVSSLLMTAGLVRALGAEQYGLIVMALAASGLSTSIVPAIGATTTKFVAEAIGLAHTERRTVAKIITASLLTVVILDVVLLAGALFFRGQLSQLVFGHVAAADRLEAGALLVLAVLVVCLQQIDGVLAAAIRGLERFRHQAVVQLWSRLLTAGIVTLVAWFTKDARLALVSQSAALAASALVRARVLKGLAPARLMFAFPGAAELKAILDFGGWMWLTAIAGAAYGTVDRILVGRVLGAAAAGGYNVIIQLTQLIHYVPSSLFAFTFPTFSRLAAQGGGERQRITRLYRKYRLIIIGLAAAIMIGLLVASGPLISLFLPNRPGSIGLWVPFVILAAGFFVLAFNVAAYYLLLALGRSKPVSLISVGSMALSLALMGALVPIYGMNGAALARVVYGAATLLFIQRARVSLRSL